MSRLDELSKTVMQFGKYKGKTFDEVPLSYLDWMSGECDLRDPEFRRALTEYLNHPTIAGELERELEDG